MRKTSILIALIALVVFVAASTGPPDETTIDLKLVDHLKAGMIEQDVYVEKEAGSDEVYRVLPKEKDQYLDAPVYTTAKEVHHNPFSEAAAGPYPKGKALDMTLGEWLEGRGKVSYTCEGGKGTVEASFENLVPEAVYTMWYFFMPKPPTKPFSGTLDLPLGARDGSDSVFRTDENGSAEYEVTFSPCLQLSGKHLASGLAIAYHSDGKTYAGDPGPFGKATHVQIFGMLPKKSEVVAEK